VPRRPRHGQDARETRRPERRRRRLRDSLRRPRRGACRRAAEVGRRQLHAGRRRQPGVPAGRRDGRLHAPGSKTPFQREPRQRAGSASQTQLGAVETCRGGHPVTAAGYPVESFRGGTIQQKLTRTSVVVILTALVLTTSAVVPYYLIAGRRSIAGELNVQAQMIALNSTSALLFDDERAATETLAALQADRNVLAAAIYTSRGTLFASYEAQPSSATAPRTTIAVPVRDAIRFSGLLAQADQTIVARGRTAGYVHIVYSLRALLVDVVRFLLITAAVLVVAVFGALMAARRVQRDLTVPITQLAGAALAVSRKTDYTVRVPPNHAIGELGMLIDTFNAMLSQIQARDEELDASARRYQRLNEDLERRVAERTSELQAINKELEAFTYSVSHDLRAPLRRIDGFSGMLAEKYGPELGTDGAHYLTRIREGTLHMGRLIDDLLNLARLGRKELTPRPTDLTSIVTRV